MRKIVLASMVYFVITMAIAGVWNLLLFPEHYASTAEQAYRNAPIIPLGMLATLLQGVSLAILFNYLKHHLSSIKDGILLSLAVGVFLVSYAALVVPAKFQITPITVYILLETIVGILQYTIHGVIFSLLFFRSNEAKNETL